MSKCSRPRASRCRRHGAPSDATLSLLLVGLFSLWKFGFLDEFLNFPYAIQQLVTNGIVPKSCKAGLQNNREATFTLSASTPVVSAPCRNAGTTDCNPFVSRIAV